MTNMKYIRTSDGIYRAEIANDRIVAIDSDGYQASYPLRTFKLHDTIEELCDFFETDNGRCTEEDGSGAELAPLYKKLWEAAMSAGNNDIYGLIKTNIGYIRVAKMNEEGELCLI